jgi:hypothetical protein
MSAKNGSVRVLVVAGAIALAWGVGASLLRRGASVPGFAPGESKSWGLQGRKLGSAWNGGKPGIPVDISSDLSGPIPAGVNQSVVVFIMIDQECTNAEVRLRALDGVVLSGQHRVDLGACRPGESMEVSTTVRVPVGGAGYLVVDVILEEVDEDGVIIKRSATRAISVVAEGARPKPRSIGKAVPAGKSGASGREDEQVIELGR